jgi:hypothetical protein
MNIQQIFISRAALEWQHNGGSKTETPVTASECVAHSKASASALVKLSTIVLTDVNSVLGLLRRVDVGDVFHVSSVVHTDPIFRVEVCKVSKFIYT